MIFIFKKIHSYVLNSISQYRSCQTKCTPSHPFNTLTLAVDIRNRYTTGIRSYLNILLYAMCIIKLYIYIYVHHTIISYVINYENALPPRPSGTIPTCLTTPRTKKEKKEKSNRNGTSFELWIIVSGGYTRRRRRRLHRRRPSSFRTYAIILYY